MIASCDYYVGTQPAPSNSTWTYTNKHGSADTTTCTTSWGWSDEWYIVTSTPIQEEPVIVKKPSRNLFDDIKKIYNKSKPIINDIPRKRIHNRFGRVCVT